MIRVASLAGVLMFAIGGSVRAQELEVQFDVAQLPGNIQGCVALDSAFNRPVSVKVAGDSAQLVTGGGIHSRMKRVRPNVYEASLEVSGGQLDFTADLGATPRTLGVVSRNLGCKWAGKPR